MHFKTIRRKRLCIPSRINPRWYIFHHPRLPTLPSRNQTSRWRPEQQECISQGAPTTYPYLSTPLIYIFQFHQSPSGPVYTKKHYFIYKFFGFTRLFDLKMKIYFKTTWRKTATHTIQNELWTIYFVPFTVSPIWSQRYTARLCSVGFVDSGYGYGVLQNFQKFRVRVWKC